MHSVSSTEVFSWSLGSKDGLGVLFQCGVWPDCSIYIINTKINEQNKTKLSKTMKSTR